MTPGKIVLLGAPGLLFGYPCALDEMGEHRGSVCEGDEVGLGVIAAGDSLQGRWHVVESNDQEDSQVLTRWKSLLIDEENRPKALLEFRFRPVDKKKLGYDEVTFGCDDYIDHPLVRGGVNRDPSRSRSTIRGYSCYDSPTVRNHTDSRRVLYEVESEPSRICFYYATVNERAAVDPEDQESGSRETFCFGYERGDGLLTVSYGSNDGEWKHASFRREEHDLAALNRDTGTQGFSGVGTTGAP